MTRFERGVRLGWLLLALAAPATAAPKPTPAKTFVGPWRISTGDGRQSCSLRLAAKPAPHGYGVTIGHDCTDAFPLQSVAAWKPYGDMIVLMSDTGFPVATFEETENGIFLSSGDPVYALRPDAGAARASQAPARMAGHWTLGPASGAPFCQLNLGADGKAATTATCRREWQAKAIARWNLAGHRLTLLDKAGHPVGGYIQRDPNTFEDERPSETPVQLWRPVR
jgi:hypothetical protein